MHYLKFQSINHHQNTILLDYYSTSMKAPFFIYIIAKAISIRLFVHIVNCIADISLISVAFYKQVRFKYPLDRLVPKFIISVSIHNFKIFIRFVD